MDCNKEEALRAMKIAETRMQKNEFNGALRILQKAQHLFPELENVAHMLAVCEVHCSAQKKVSGSGVDWYAILGVEKTVDEITLKKQFRKLALLLHPDKNKFAGAEAAFKLIGEANRVLSDRESRSLYDIKFRNSVISHSSHAPKPPAHHQMPCSGARNYNVSGSKQESRPPHFQPVSPDNYGKFHGSNGYQQTHVGTFFTVCSACYMKFEYLKHFIGKALRCKSCGAAFIAVESRTQDSVHNFQYAQSASSTKFTTVEFSNPDAGNNGVSSSSTPFEIGSRRTDGALGTAGSSQNGSDTGQINAETDGAYPFGRSSQQKQRVFAKKNLDNLNEFVRPPKRARNNGDVPVNTGYGNPDAKPDPECDEAEGLVTCPKPEFNNFEKLRSGFSAGQVWACYDNDGMPRLYVRIRKVFSSGFKLQIVWLGPVLKSEAERNWSSKELPIACGYYRMAMAEETEDPYMFSHQMSCVKMSSESRVRKVQFAVYPQKGEIWAMFKNWDMNWISDAKKHLPHKYEYVEVLSDFEENSGVRVAYLRRMPGFVSLYKQVDEENAGEDAFCRIPPDEKYRFSHRVPSFKMTGKERTDVPSGSVELDPASLDLEELLDSLEKDRDRKKCHGTMLDSNFRSNMANSGKNSGDDRKVVMGLSASTAQNNVSLARGESHVFSRPDASSSCFNGQSISTKEEPTKTENGSNYSRRSSRGGNKAHSHRGS